MKVLLLSGTREARRLAAWLEEESIPAIASFAGVTRSPELPRIETRLGGFGGEDAFRDYLHAEAITHILDATHPFAARMSHRSARVAVQIGIPYRQLLRPAWRPEVGDTWVSLKQEEDAAQHIKAGSRVFLATGRQTLDRFGALQDSYLICRQIDPPSGPFPFSNGEYLIGRPPFSVDDEEALFRKLRIDWLVVKNAGGEMSATKLVAARRLGLPVAMIARPPQPEGEKLQTVKEAQTWLRSQKE
ncbi:MAG: cobalt-precorrin-6A reductase [Rhodobacteraceae bacterium]|nr:cobalt-precorrin-6A reductase [Paracoccaceae bacterium]